MRMLVKVMLAFNRGLQRCTMETWREWCVLVRLVVRVMLLDELCWQRDPFGLNSSSNLFFT